MRSFSQSKSVLPVAALCALVALPAATASAAQSWLPPTELSLDGHASSTPIVGMNPRGDVAAVWREGTQVRAVTHDAGHGYSPADVLAENGSAPAIAIGRSGGTAAIWVGSDGVVRASFRDPSEVAFGPAVAVSAEGQTAREPNIALDAEGNATAVWSRFNGTKWVVQSATRAASAAAFDPAVDLSTRSWDVGAGAPGLAVNADGDAVVAWLSAVDNAGFPASEIQAATRSSGGSFGAPAALTFPRIVLDAPKVAMNDSGDAGVIWATDSVPGDVGTWHRAVQATVRPAGGAWGAAVDVATEGDGRSVGADLTSAMVGLAADGSAIALWETGDESPDLPNWVEVSTRPVGGSFGPRTRLSSVSEHARRPRLAMNRSGEAIAAWDATPWQNGGQGTTPTVHVARRAAGGAFAPAIDLQANAFAATVAIDADGDAVAGWTHGAQLGTPFPNAAHAQLAGFDATGPELRELTVPETALDATPVSFSVYAFDVWASPAPVTWDFGDGQTASGEDVEHVFASHGRYTVTVTASDAVGNATTESRPITITGDAPPADPGDTTPPDTTIDDGPGSSTSSTTPIVRFGSEPGATFRCRLTRQGTTPGSFLRCTSPHRLGPLPEGRYTFEVRAVDRSLKVDPTPAQRPFTVDTTPPDTALALVAVDPNAPLGARVATRAGVRARPDGSTDLAISCPRNATVDCDGSVRLANAAAVVGQSNIALERGETRAAYLRLAPAAINRLEQRGKLRLRVELTQQRPGGAVLVQRAPLTLLPAAGAVRVLDAGKELPVTKSGARLRLACPASAPTGCKGVVALTRGDRLAPSLGASRFALRAGQQRRLVIHLTSAARAHVAQTRLVPAVIELSTKPSKTPKRLAVFLRSGEEN